MNGMENFLDPAHLLRRTAWLKSLARSLVADEARADDVAQEAWLALLRSPPDHPQATASWLRSVVRKLAFRSHRAESRRERHERLAARAAEVDAAPGELLDRFDLHRRLVELVAGLDEPHRSTILLRFFEELSPGEIARRQAVAVTTVRWRLQRALDTLRARLD
ncbi:MAG: RNA polymerase sigma factor, partial [Thermoanaerobaculia bacterium]